MQASSVIQKDAQKVLGAILEYLLTSPSKSQADIILTNKDLSAKEQYTQLWALFADEVFS